MGWGRSDRLCERSFSSPLDLSLTGPSGPPELSGNTHANPHTPPLGPRPIESLVGAAESASVRGSSEMVSVCSQGWELRLSVLA